MTGSTFSGDSIMSDPIVASTRYGDFKGTFSYNGWAGMGFPDLAEVLNEMVDLGNHTLVGFELSILGGNDGLHCYLTVFATDVASTPGEVEEYARKHGSVPVKKFRPDEDLQPADLVKLLNSLKEFSIVGKLRGIDIHPVKED
jgi:hypothetical protein